MVSNYKISKVRYHFQSITNINVYSNKDIINIIITTFLKLKYKLRIIITYYSYKLYFHIQCIVYFNSIPKVLNDRQSKIVNDELFAYYR